jgi:hypothetical protein
METRHMNDRPDTPRNRGDKDAPHVSPVTPTEDVRTVAINQISWSAVFAGVAIGLISQLLLNMLGLGLGFATLDPGTSDNPSAGSFSIGAAIWWTVSGIVAAFLGGWVAGRTSGKPKESTAGWHGLTSWAVTSLIVIYLLTSAVSSVIGGAMGALSSAVGGIGRTAATAAATAAPAAASNPGAVSSAAQQAQQATGIEDPGALKDVAVAAGKAISSGDPQQAAQAREQAAQTLSRENNIPVEQARQQVAQREQQVTQQATQLKQTATQAADTASTAASAAALLAAISLLLGAVAGWFGGRRGAVHPTVTGLPNR